GHETTVNLIANGMLALLRHPVELERLRGDPALAVPAVEELLRFDSPPQLVSRVVAEECELRGKTLRSGDSVLLGIGPANPDPAHFRRARAARPRPHAEPARGVRARHAFLSWRAALLPRGARRDSRAARPLPGPGARRRARLAAHDRPPWPRAPARTSRLTGP